MSDDDAIRLELAGVREELARLRAVIGELDLSQVAELRAMLKLALARKARGRKPEAPRRPAPPEIREGVRNKLAGAAAKRRAKAKGAA